MSELIVVAAGLYCLACFAVPVFQTATFFGCLTTHWPLVDNYIIETSDGRQRVGLFDKAICIPGSGGDSDFDKRRGRGGGATGGNRGGVGGGGGGWYGWGTHPTANPPVHKWMCGDDALNDGTANANLLGILDTKSKARYALLLMPLLGMACFLTMLWAFYAFAFRGKRCMCYKGDRWCGQLVSLRYFVYVFYIATLMAFLILLIEWLSVRHEIQALGATDIQNGSVVGIVGGVMVGVTWAIYLSWVCGAWCCVHSATKAEKKRVKEHWKWCCGVRLWRKLRNRGSHDMVSRTRV